MYFFINRSYPPKIFFFKYPTIIFDYVYYSSFILIYTQMKKMKKKKISCDAIYYIRIHTINSHKEECIAYCWQAGDLFFLSFSRSLSPFSAFHSTFFCLWFAFSQFVVTVTFVFRFYCHYYCSYICCRTLWYFTGTFDFISVAFQHGINLYIFTWCNNNLTIIFPFKIKYFYSKITNYSSIFFSLLYVRVRVVCVCLLFCSSF